MALASRSLRFIWLAAFASMGAGVASAATDCSGPGSWRVGLLAGTAVQSDLVEVVPKAATGGLKLADSVMGGLIARRSLTREAGFSGACWTLDSSVAWHGGETSHRELVLAIRPEWSLARLGRVTVLVAWGLGGSLSLGKPWSDYEHPSRPDGYRALLHMSPEVGVRWGQGADQWDIGIRVHHRSGVYGLIAPSKVGANYVTLLVMRGL